MSTITRTQNAFAELRRRYQMNIYTGASTLA